MLAFCRFINSLAIWDRALFATCISPISVAFIFVFALLHSVAQKAFKNTFGSTHPVPDIYFIISQNVFSLSQLKHICFFILLL